MKIKVESYTQNGTQRAILETIFADEYWTEHKNPDGSVLKVKITAATELNERNSVAKSDTKN